MDLEDILTIVAVLLGPLGLIYWKLRKKKMKTPEELLEKGQQINEKAQEKIDEAITEALEEKEELKDEFNKKTKDVVNQINEKYVEAQDDGQGVNDFLKNVGKQVRDKDR